MFLNSKYYKIKLFKKEIWGNKIYSSFNLIYNYKSRISNLNYNNLTYIKIYSSRLIVNSDIVRSCPLFYKINNKNKLIISDNPYYLVSDEFTLNISSKEEYLNYGFCFNKNTLINSIYQIPPGCILYFNYSNKKIIIKKKYIFRKSNVDLTFNQSYFELKKKLDFYLDKSFSDLDLDNKKIIIPLSGGYDSRIILIKLIEKGFKDNIICFTYGVKSDLEVQLSKKVANSLNIKWYFVEYTDELLKRYFNSKQYDDYVWYVSNLCSMPHTQDFFAIKYLIDNRIISKNDIVIPGHSGDFIAGSRLVHLSKDYLSDIYNYHSLIKNKKNICLLNNYFNNLKFKYNSDYFEYFDINERQSKFIVNSLRVYEFFNLNWRIPLWDYDLVIFFSNIFNNYRYNKKIYDDLLLDYFNKYKVNFGNDLKNNNIKSKLYYLYNLCPINFRVYLKNLAKSKIGLFLNIYKEPGLFYSSKYLNYKIEKNSYKIGCWLNYYDANYYYYLLKKWLDEKN